MNLYILLVILTITVISICDTIPDREKQNRILIAKRKWEKILQAYAKKSIARPNQPQNRYNRDAAHRLYNKGDPPKPTTTTTTTTKSPYDLKREEEAKALQRNPKNIPSLLQEDIKKFKKHLKELAHRYDKKEKKEIPCTTNEDCSNDTCCMTHATGQGFCNDRPTKLKDQCGDFCPCGDENHECKIPINENNEQNTYTKKCLNKNQAEYFNSKLMKQLREAKHKLALGQAKRNLAIGPRVPRDSSGLRRPA